MEMREEVKGIILIIIGTALLLTAFWNIDYCMNSYAFKRPQQPEFGKVGIPGLGLIDAGLLWNISAFFMALPGVILIAWGSYKIGASKG